MELPGDYPEDLAAGIAPDGAPASPLRSLMRPQILLPGAVVLGMIAVAFGVQPGSGKQQAGSDLPAVTPSAVVSPSVSPSAAAPTRTAQPSPTTRTGTPSASDGLTIAAPEAATATGDVAGARATPSPTPGTDFSREATECGAIQEGSFPIVIEQTLGGLSVRVVRVTVFPIEYFRCILLATGGREAVTLAESVGKAGRAGSTHAVLVDLWLTNPGKDFGQLNLRTASLAVASQVFAPLATLGGRSESVVASGQGRTVTLVVAIQNGVGPTTGPMTLTVEAPLYGGKQTAGKYQLFLPTP
ncbi:MAG: hypothetical protein HY875_17295 [Chloroflexi bacterium]|nr:hypothetical protein [Chloroflexota bacterium]